MRYLAAPFAALALLAATPPPALPQPGGALPMPSFGVNGKTTCFRPPYNGRPGATLLFNGPEEKPVNSVLVTPSRAATSAPAVLWVHWLGETATTNHTEFQGDAEALAKRGAVSMLVDMPWSQKEWFTALRTPENDFTDTIAQVVTLRRALDCLIAIPGVDKTRIAYVGHDFGAMDGALLVAVDDRPAYAVMMAPTLSFWEWYLLGKRPDNVAAYVAHMSPLDLPGWLSRGQQKATLLQFGQNDEYVSQATGIAFRNAVPDRDRTFKAYKLDHALNDETVHVDRIAWLITKLGL